MPMPKNTGLSLHPERRRLISGENEKMAKCQHPKTQVLTFIWMEVSFISRENEKWLIDDA
jgi:hypothetical protein